MRILTAALVLALAGGSSAFAQGAGVGDATYLKMARCAGLASGGLGDAAGFDTWLKDNAGNRSNFITTQADARRAEAKAQAKRAKGYVKSELEQELSGPCAAIKS
jgi:hypothetical protein